MVSPDSAKVRVLRSIPPLKTKRKLQSLLGIVNYLNKFLPMTVDICKSLQRLTYVKGTGHIKTYTNEPNH